MKWQPRKKRDHRSHFIPVFHIFGFHPACKWSSCTALIILKDIFNRLPRSLFTISVCTGVSRGADFTELPRCFSEKWIRQKNSGTFFSSFWVGREERWEGSKIKYTWLIITFAYFATLVSFNCRSSSVTIRKTLEVELVLPDTHTYKRE